MLGSACVLAGACVLFYVAYVVVAAIKATVRPGYKSYMRAFKEELTKEWM